jgi:predicted house-cleaning noncanonical NTP pyrophosphatase (MazG superfamily)
MGEKIVYNKLVRGRIPEIIEADGLFAKTIVLDAVAHLAETRNKVLEELQEYDEAVEADDNEKILGEIVDLRELIETLTRLHGFTLAELHRAQMKKREERGDFDGAYF